MKESRRRTLIAGLVLVGLTNAFVLGGAAYNRTGAPDSTLKLTERELQAPYLWAGRKENSGLALQLQWRLPPGHGSAIGPYGLTSYSGGIADWLDAQKMASLGFDVNLPAAKSRSSRGSAYERQLPRDVLLVLELDGPAYREALERTARAAKEVEEKDERGQGKKTADGMMDRETRLNSRLFAVDAGLDRAALRKKFPDRAKYAIVRGQVRPAWLPGGKPAGVIDKLSVAQVNVPLEMRGVFAGLTPSSYTGSNEGRKQFEASLAFGRRLEPWLLSATSK